MEEKKMKKSEKIKLTVSFLVILVPAIVGLIVWNRLPDELPIHYNY